MNPFGLVSSKPEGGINLSYLKLLRSAGRLSKVEEDWIDDATKHVITQLGYVDDLAIERRLKETSVL